MADLESTHRTFALIGPGRAGSTIALGLSEIGWEPIAVAGVSPDRDSTLDAAALLNCPAVEMPKAGTGADLVVIATPDAAIESVATSVSVQMKAGSLLIHLAGSQGLAVFHGAMRFRNDLRFGAMHPLVSIPTVTLGLERLPGAWCAVAGDSEVARVACELGMTPFNVPDADRPAYHAAAAVAANHLVAILGQVQRIAEASDTPFEAFLPLVHSAIANVEELGPKAALTGPVSRGDRETIKKHLDAIGADEQETYKALAAEALKLSGKHDALLQAVLDADEVPSHIRQFDQIDDDQASSDEPDGDR